MCGAYQHLSNPSLDKHIVATLRPDKIMLKKALAKQSHVIATVEEEVGALP